MPLARVEFVSYEARCLQGGAFAVWCVAVTRPNTYPLRQRNVLQQFTRCIRLYIVPAAHSRTDGLDMQPVEDGVFSSRSSPNNEVAVEIDAMPGVMNLIL